MEDWVIIYICLGLAWGIFAFWMIKNEEYGALRCIGVCTLNAFGWCIALPVWLYAKIVLKRNTLFK